MSSHHMKRLLFPLGALLGAAFSGTAFGDELHYNNILIGERATGMGGAYTAVSDDPSGLFYNPAGIVYAGRKNISASVNAFHRTSTVYKNALRGGDWVRESSALLPNFFGFVQPLGSGTIGFSYAVTDSILEDQDSRFSFSGTEPNDLEEFVINVNNQDTTTKIGPSYALELSDRFSLGATLYLHMRNQQLINNQWVRQRNGEFQWVNAYLETEEIGLEPIIGFMWSPADQWSFGLSVRKPQLLSSETQYQNTCITNITDPGITLDAQCQSPAGNVDPNDPRDPSLISGSAERDLPFNTRIGVAYFPSNRLLISGDFSYYTATDATTFANGREATWDVAVGAEYYLSDQWALRGGVFTNNANTPEIARDRVNQDDHVNLVGFSLSASRFTRSSSITGGVSYSQGSGEAQVIGGVANVQKVEMNTFTAFLSTSYNY